MDGKMEFFTAENAEHAESLWFVVHRKVQAKIA
jgi:hypothetical protein